MAKHDKSLSAKREDRQVEAKLQELKKELYHNEHRLREASLGYKDLVARKTSILSSICALRKFREERRRNSSSRF
jgi:hypothetical protein